MYKTKCGYINIRVDVENGVYLLDYESATGKSYMCKLLKGSKDVLSYTYHDVFISNINEVLCKSNYRVIFLDRYDLYESEETDRLLNFLSGKSVILLDLKSGWYDYDYSMAKVNLGSNYIEVIKW